MKIEKFDETTKGFHLSPLFLFPKKINFEKKVKIHFSKCLCTEKNVTTDQLSLSLIVNK